MKTIDFPAPHRVPWTLQPGCPAMSQTTRLGFLAFTIAAAAFLFLGLGITAIVLAGRSSTSGESGGSVLSISGKPSEGREGMEWTLKELVGYLNSQGMDFSVLTADVEVDGTSAIWSSRDGHVVVHRYATRERAKDVAGTSANAFAWGRFSIGPAPALAGRIRALLGV